MADIFISYRDGDAGGYAGRLVDNLEGRFGRDRVLHDKTTLKPGSVWREWIERSILGTSMVIVVIGPDWDHPRNLDRLHSADDILRWEIELALDAGIPMVPVLINRTELPKPATLPGSIHRLAEAHTLQIHNAGWHKDIEPLYAVVLERFERLAGRPRSAASATVVAWPDALREELAAAECRSPILIAVDTEEDPLGEQEFPLTQRHMTVTLKEAELDRVVQTAADVLDGEAEFDEVVRASRQVWHELEGAQPLLADLIGRISGTGFSQPVAWCGRSRLLTRFRNVVLIAHTGNGFLSVDAGAHYFLPVTGEDRTLQPRRHGPPSTDTVDLREAPPCPQQLGDAAAEEVVLLVDPDNLATTCRSLAALVRARPLSPTRALLAFSPAVEPDAQLVDELLSHLPCLILQSHLRKMSASSVMTLTGAVLVATSPPGAAQDLVVFGLFGPDQVVEQASDLGQAQLDEVVGAAWWPPFFDRVTVR